MDKRRLTSVTIVIAFLFINVSVYGQEVFFSPNGGCTEKVIQEIDKSENRLMWLCIALLQSLLPTHCSGLWSEG